MGRRESLKLMSSQHESSEKKESQPKRNWSTLPRKFGPKNWAAVSPSKRVSESWNNTLPRKFGSENWSKFVSVRDGEQEHHGQRESMSAPLLPRRNSMSSQSSNLGRGTYQQVNSTLSLKRGNFSALFSSSERQFLSVRYLTELSCPGEVKPYGAEIWGQPPSIATNQQRPKH